MNKLIAEAFGTAWLVIGGCGAALFGADHTGISLAFGLSVMTMAYAIGPISGCHLNPAVTIGLAVAKRFDRKQVGPYIAAQVVGAIAGAALLATIIKLSDGSLGSFAANGFDGKGGAAKLGGAFVVELWLTFFFLFVILGATSSKAPAGFAPIAIGLCLTLIHLVAIKLTSTSVNPARSTSQALFAGADYLKMLWLFWVAPIAGGALAGFVFPRISGDKT